MNAKEARAKMGAPEQDPMDALFTRLWFCGVKARSGLDSTQALELLIEHPNRVKSADDIDRFSKYRSYELGLKVPKRIWGRAYSPDLAEAKFPGTAAVLDSPVKTLVKQQPCSLIWTDLHLRSRSTIVTGLLFDQAQLGKDGSPVMRPFDDHLSKQLGEIGSLDALTAAVLLMKRAELIASPELREHAWRAYARAVPRVAALPEVAPVAAEFFEVIDSVFKYWIYERFDTRLDFKVSVYETRKAFIGTDEEYFEVVILNVRGMLALKKLTSYIGLSGDRGNTVLSVDFG